mgnify:CR=1 FL=1
MLGAEEVHDVVDDVVLSHTLGQPIHTDTPTSTAEVCLRMSKLFLHEPGCNGELVVTDDSLQTRMSTADTLHELPVVERKMLERLQDQFWRDAR